MAMRVRGTLAMMITLSSPCMASPAAEFSVDPGPAAPSAAAYLQRIRQPVAAADPAAGYQPRTTFDNTPYRFDMSQNGRRMTAEEFDAWMKARGIRVATGKPAGAPDTPTPPATPTSAATPACQAAAQRNC